MSDGDVLRLNKKLFESVINSGKRYFKLSHQLSNAELKKWGFTHNDKDIDEIIDNLDYAQGELTYERYLELMNDEVEMKKD